MSPSRQAAHPLLRNRPLVALVALLAMVLTGFSAAQAFAADSPPAGEYEGTSTAYNGATVSFDIDANGVMSNFNSESYCWDGFLNYGTVQWTGMPATQIEAGVPFELEWTYDTGDVSPYYELTGTVNADGTASGTGRAGFLPYGTCGGMPFTWTASTSGGGQDPDPVYEPTVTVSPSSLSETQLADNGIVVEGQDLPPSTAVELLINDSVIDSATSLYNGNVLFDYSSTTLGAGTHDVRLQTADYSAATTFTVTEDPAPVYDPQVSFTPSTLTESELLGTGVTLNATGYPADVTVTINWVGMEMGGPALTDANGEFVWEGIFAEGAEPGTYTAEVSYEDLSESATFTVTADPEPEPVYEPTASASPSSLSESDLADSGVTVTGADFPPNETVALTVGGAAAGSQDADANGDVFFTYTSSTLGTGPHDAVLTSGALTATASFTVTEDPAPVYDPQISVTPSTMTVSEAADNGVTIAVTGFPANVEIGVEVSDQFDVSVNTDENGAVTIDGIFLEGLDEGPLTFQASYGDLSAQTIVTITADEDPAPVYDPEAAVNPSSVTESVLADSGVTVTGNGFPENVAVSLYVGGDQVAVADSDSNGDIEFTYTSDALAPGEYTVRLEADAEGATVELTLTVTADEIPVPVTIPAVEPGPEDLDPALEGDVGVPASAAPGDSIVLTVDGVDPGTEVGVWIFSEAVYLGTHTVDANGEVTVTIPAGIAPGTHTISVWTEEGLLGWDTIVITSAADDDPVVTDPGTDPVTGPGAGGDGLAATGGTLSATMVLTVGLLLAFGFAMVFRARTRRSTTA